MLKEYKTVLNFGVAELEEKKSRFIASVKPVSTEEQALEFINELRTKYWDASHNVYAYHVNGNSGAQRFSDDGEPSGTAGMPVLEVIKRVGVQDLAVVVTRYFGGTLLGAAGLIRAYGKCAAMGIEAACMVNRRLCRHVSIVVEYTLFGKVQNLLISKKFIIKDVIYEVDVEIITLIPEDDLDGFLKMVTETTNGKAVIVQGEAGFITLREDGCYIPGRK